MGQLFKEVGQYITSGSDEIWVEIGSDRYEGSSVFLADLAQEHSAVLHSVDVSTLASTRIRHPNIVWHINDGERWCQNILPGLNKQVGLVYFDNFDYTWNINEWNDRVRDQKKEYIELYKIELTNQNCQVTHFKQMLAIEPYLTDDATIICDDTYTLNDCWVGKCGGIVLYLLSKGWEISVAKDFGVILKRCKK